MNEKHSNIENVEKQLDENFKKPELTETINNPKKTQKSDNLSNEEVDKQNDKKETTEAISEIKQQIKPKKSLALPYKEPEWSGLPEKTEKDYTIEVLKNGSIVEIINLMSKPFWVIGKLPSCDIVMQHPTISRNHAVLQYRCKTSETEKPGFYIYDLDSTHGTYVNKIKIKAKFYQRLHVGFMTKFGCSSRNYILCGPDDNVDDSLITIAKMKRIQLDGFRRLEEEQKKREEQASKVEERGIDWGMGEDAQEDEIDLSDNPFASTNNEDFFINNPKKTLRGFFEREGLNLEYDCTEQGIGQFLCKVELPVDDEKGRPIVAEVLHKGKKKEAVVQCALEACRILDRCGVLRQATHESRKRKVKNWEENDYYDSDEDTYLDRTGTIEKKREMRMKGRIPQKIETYESLLEKEKFIKNSIEQIEEKIIESEKILDEEQPVDPNADSLDTFMKQLEDDKPTKQSINKLKKELLKLKQDHLKVLKLIKVTKPAALPPLLTGNPSIVPSTSTCTSTCTSTNTSTSTSDNDSIKIKTHSKKIKPLYKFEKRPKITLHDSSNNKKEEAKEILEEKEEEQEEEEEEEEEEDDDEEIVTQNIDDQEESVVESSSSTSLTMAENFSLNPFKKFPNHLTFKKFEKIVATNLPPIALKHKDKLSKILVNLKKLASDGDRIDVDWKTLEAKKRKVMKLITDNNNSGPNAKLEYKISAEIGRILNELNIMTDQKLKVVKNVTTIGTELKLISDEIDADLKKMKEKNDDEIDDYDEDDGDGEGCKCRLKCDKKHMLKRLINQQSLYEKDESYNMWIAPSDQTGDGRTSLNEKYGY